MILPHPEAGKFFQNKANDYQRWIRGMQKLQRNLRRLLMKNIYRNGRKSA